MALRGRKPAGNTRLRALISGPAGHGKTMAAIQMPTPYIIDCESGCEHYGDIIEKRGGVVYETSDVDEVISEVKSLMTEKHGYATLVIDPLTVLFEQSTVDAERKVGDSFGKHTALAGRWMSRLMDLIRQLDMNVVFTAHSRAIWRDGNYIGESFDGWKKSDYIVDVHFHLTRHNSGEHLAEVRKTRLSEFPDMLRFSWSYDKVCEMYGREKLERHAQITELASPSQVQDFSTLLARLSDDERVRLKIDKAIKGYDDFSDMPAAKIAAGVEHIERYLATTGAV